jgi:hypothetical protein
VVVSPRTLPPARGAFDAFRVLAAASDSKSTSVFVFPRAGFELNRDEMNAPPAPPGAGADCCADDEDLFVKYALAFPLFACPFPLGPLTPLGCVAALASAETSTKSSAPPGATRARFAGRSSAGAGMIRLTTSGRVIGGSALGFSTRRLAALFAFNLCGDQRRRSPATVSATHRSVHRPPCFFLGAAEPELVAKLSSMPSSMVMEGWRKDKGDEE